MAKTSAVIFSRDADQTEKNKRNTQDANKKPRLAALEFLRCLNNGFASSWGVRLEFFLPQEDRAEEAEAVEKSMSVSVPKVLPAAVLAMDECSIGWSALYFLMFHLQGNILGLRDPAHRAHNDFKLSVKASGFWPTIVSTVLVFNLPHGPWGSGRFWQIARSAAASYCAQSSNDQLLRYLSEKISTEWELDLSDVHGDVLLQALDSKGPKVSLTRWMSWLHAAKIHMRHWWSRLLVLLVAGLEMGYFKKAKDFQVLDQSGGRNLIQASAEPDVAEGEPSEIPTAREDTDVRALQQQAKNNIHTSCLIMADVDVHQQASMILEICTPLCQEHSDTVTTLRKGSYASQQLHASWACGSWLKVIRDTVALTKDLEALGRCGFLTHAFLSSHTMSTEQSQLLVQTENFMGQRFYQLMRSLVFTRTKSMLWHTLSTPGLLAAPILAEGHISISFSSK